MGPDEFDMDAGVATIAEGLNLGGEEHVDDPPDAPQTTQPAQSTEPVQSTAPTVRPPPKSWAKDYHEPWGKLDPKVQEYVELREKQMLDGIEQYKGDSSLGRTLKEVILPYKAAIAAQGLDEAKAVGYLLNVHHRLTNGSPEQRLMAFKELGRNMGFVGPDNPQQIDPAVREIAERQARIEASMNREAQERYKQTERKVNDTVQSFAGEKDEKGNLKHPYFDEVGEDIVVFINAGLELSDAYDRAVYANPVTRAKETARLQQEAQAKLRDKGKQEATEARRASSTNVRSRDTNRAPTGLMGTMEDTLKETLAATKARTH